MALPEHLLLSDLLRLRVRCDQGLDHGAGQQGWMHPPVHRLLGWVSKPVGFGSRPMVWRLNQLRGLGEHEALVQGPSTATDADTLARLPTLLEAVLMGRSGDPLGTLVDLAVELRTGRILHYLVSRSDPRLPGSSRWRLSPDRIVDQQPGQVVSAVGGLDDLPLAKASLRQEFLQRSRRWRAQVGQETARLRDQFQQAGDRFEDRLEGWMEEPPWDEPARGETIPDELDREQRQEPWEAFEAEQAWEGRPEPSDDWERLRPPVGEDAVDDEPWTPPVRRRRRTPRPDEDPWI
ncbi:RNA methyltransferase [Cyanobium sp. Morenito 9A2]|uniref:RNA methyltransferase n=1 Tax=Cyanobium sp. Morenito 9A2 TaxID=2823718 RepID=UPI0020CF1247|nr:RNA methyltransferase [Cyanobium sp. Morenito 9A2]MCP9850315.1 RNA methyltransferase [Cyanobium sp. Morenito 9A2]